MVKKALCVKRSEVADIIPIPSDIDTLGVNSYSYPLCNYPDKFSHFLDLETELRPRKTGDETDCELDPNYLQLIPYIALFKREHAGYKVLSYVRGKVGDEDRLHNLMSVGFGGHVEEDATSQNDLHTVLAQCAIREMLEEINFDLVEHFGSFQAVKEYIMKRAYLLYDDTSAVQQVHLGVSINLFMPDISDELFFDAIRAEEGTIEDHKFLPVDFNLQNHYDFENWSKLVLNTIYR